MTIHEKANKIGIYVWKKAFEKIYSKEADFKEKEKKNLFHHSQTILYFFQLQHEGALNFTDTCDKNDTIDLLNLIRCSSCKHDQNNDKVNAVMTSLRALFMNFHKSM